MHYFSIYVLFILKINDFTCANPKDSENVEFVPVNVNLDDTVSYFMDHKPTSSHGIKSKLLNLAHLQVEAEIFRVDAEQNELPYCFSDKAHELMSCKVTTKGSYCGRKAEELDPELCQVSTFDQKIQYCIPNQDSMPSKNESRHSMANPEELQFPARFMTCRRFAERLINQNNLEMYIKYANMFVRVCCNPEAALRFIRIIPKPAAQMDFEKPDLTNDLELGGYLMSNDLKAVPFDDLHFIWNMNLEEGGLGKSKETKITSKERIESHENEDKSIPIAYPKYDLSSSWKKKKRPTPTRIPKVIRKCTYLYSWICKWLTKVQ